MRRYLLLLLLLGMAFIHLSTSETPRDAAPEVLTLQWNKAYPDDTIDKALIGLEWALSYSGAMLPNAPYAIMLEKDKINIRLDELGFDDKAIKHLRQLHLKIKQSPEYQATKAIDLGRYVTLLLGAPEHYYRITGLPNQLDDLLSKYEFKPEIGYVNRSNVSLVHRKIRFSEQKEMRQLLMAIETDSVTGEIYEYETIEIMPNGQLRFGIFDSDGSRKNSAGNSHSEAGKPAKCLWCHESKISQMFRPQSDVSGFLTYRALQDRLVAFNQSLAQMKSALVAGVNFSQTQQHTQTELLYISFMEPSAERLSLEWGMSIQQVQALLSRLPVHEHEEFPFLGKLYDRNAIEGLAPYKGLPVSTHVREASIVEVNHLTP